MVKMIRLRINKKGILFTIGLTFLTLVVLMLAVLVFHNAQKSEEMIAKLVVLDRVYDLGNSIRQGLRDIFRLKSGISINITDSGVSFEEILPNTNRATFNNSLNQFKGFIESNISNINLTIMGIGEMPLRIMPNNIVYKHKGNWSDIEVLPTSINFDGYSIFIDSDKNVSCSWDVESGGFNLSLEVKGDAIGCSYTSQMIDPNDDGEISIVSPEDGNIMLIEVDNGRLLINRTKDIEVRARTTVIINQPQIEIIADSLILGIDFGDFGISKESEVRIV